MIDLVNSRSCQSLFCKPGVGLKFKHHKGMQSESHVLSEAFAQSLSKLPFLFPSLQPFPVALRLLLKTVVLLGQCLRSAVR